MDNFEGFRNSDEMDNINNMDNIRTDESSDDEQEVVQRLPKRYVRDGDNPFEFYDDIEFKRRFRFSKDSVMHGLLPKIQDQLIKPDNRGLPISPVIQLLVCLRFYATANYQVVIGDLLNISQATVSRIIFRVSTLIAALMYDNIRMPVTEEARTENKELFRQLGMGKDGIGLPGIDGAIDCTHIRLSHTRFNELREVYRNRKGYFSLNVQHVWFSSVEYQFVTKQAVVGPRMEFLDIVPEWPGGQHDSRIFENSRIYMRYHQRQLNGTLVGDAGYPCLPFLLTPLANPVTDAEQCYNIVQGRTRGIVERTFRIWKRRFPCLSEGLGTKLICTTTIVVACAVLHNLSLTLDNILPGEEQPDEEEQDIPAVQPHWQPDEGFAVRQVLIEQLFA